MSLISVIIPARNAGAHLAFQLEALASQAFDGHWELIIVDNGSSDDTARVAERMCARFEHLRVVDASDRKGINYARNAGAAAARGEFLLFVDSDDVVAPGWLVAMSDAALHADFVAGRLDRTRHIDPDHLPAGWEVSGLQVWPDFLAFASGANFGVRASALAQVGGFDESYWGGGDDVDLSWKLQLAGYGLRFVPAAIVWYRERARLRAVAKQFFSYGRQDPHLFRDFAAHGMPPRRWRAGVRSWLGLVTAIPRSIGNAGRRRQWVGSVSRRAGRVAGSVRYGTLYL